MAAIPPMMVFILNTTGNAMPAMNALNNTTTPRIAMSAPRKPCPQPAPRNAITILLTSIKIPINPRLAANVVLTARLVHKGWSLTK